MSKLHLVGAPPLQPLFNASSGLSIAPRATSHPRLKSKILFNCTEQLHARALRSCNILKRVLYKRANLS